MSDLPSQSLKWCEVHFAGAVEKMAGCLVWRAKVEGNPLISRREPDCKLVDRLLVDPKAIDYEAMTNVMETRLGTSAYDDTEDDETVRLMFDAAIDGGEDASAAST